MFIRQVFIRNITAETSENRKQERHRHTMSSVQVVVRLRPLNEKEKRYGTLPVISASTTDRTVTVIKGTGSKQARSSFSFDNVFTAFSTQEEVFDATLKPVLKDVLMGYESTVFAYGQTGTGKTHTMEGDLSNTEEFGVIPRSAQAIFHALMNPEYQSYNVTCSYLEIYNEDLCDLLVDGKRQAKLEIIGGKNGPFCRGLSETQVACAADVLKLMQKAQHQRRVGETNMNKQSSRSHCIFTLSIDAKRRVPDGSVFECKGKLHMVDLAGSECAKTANMEKGSVDQVARERERMNINRSLLTLGRVVSMLKDKSSGKKNSSSVRIPYRDSKLTRILQESLGGRCKTCIIATLSPSVTAIEESASTLKYAQAANGILNKPVSASYMSHTPSNGMSSEKVGSGSHAAGAVEHWQEMECRLEYMQGQVDESKAALARKHLLQQELVEQAEKAEASRLESERRYQEATTQITSLKEALEKEVTQKQAAEKSLRQTETALKRTTEVLRATQKTETRLTAEATALIIALESSVANGDDMYRQIVENRDAYIKRKKATRQFNSAAVSLLEKVLASLSEVSAQNKDYHVQVNTFATDGADQQLAFVQNALEVIHSSSEGATSIISTINACLREEHGMLPELAATASSVTKGVTSARAIVVDAEHHLQAHWESDRKALVQFSLRLNELESIHSMSLNETLLALDKSVSDSKIYISNMVKSATKALDAVRGERENTREAMRNILEQWKESTTESSRKIEENSNVHNNAVNKKLHMVTSEMQRCDDIEAHLTSQRSLLETTGTFHVDELESQRKLLVSQNEAFTESFDRQKEFCQRFVKNVLTGVEEIVQKQMEMVTKEQNESYSCMVGTNQRLVEKHSHVEHSAKSILHTVESTNKSLQEQVECVRSNETEVANFLKKTSCVLVDINNVSVEQKESTKDFSATSSNYIQDSHNLEVNAHAISEAIITDGERCANHLTESVLGDGVGRVEHLAKSGRDVVSFSKDEVLATMASSINDIEMPRESAMERFTQECNEIKKRMSIGEADMNMKGSELSKMADASVDKILSEKSSFISNAADRHSSNVSVLKNEMLQTARNHQNEVSAGLLESLTRTADTKTRVGNFADSVIEARDAESAPEKKTVVYSSHLTATPSEEVILQKIEIDIIENDGSLQFETIPEDDPSTECEEIGNVSSCSPVLQLQSPNMDNVRSSLNKSKGNVVKHEGLKNSHKRGQSGGQHITTKRRRK